MLRLRYGILLPQNYETIQGLHAAVDYADINYDFSVLHFKNTNGDWLVSRSTLELKAGNSVELEMWQDWQIQYSKVRQQFEELLGRFCSSEEREEYMALFKEYAFSAEQEIVSKWVKL